MTKFKKIFSMVACFAMVTSSMAALSANASSTETDIFTTSVVDYDENESRAVNPNHTGTYFAPNGTSFIQITSSECNLFQVDYAGYSKICGYTSVFSNGTAGHSFSATLYAGQWYYYSGSSIVHPNFTITVTGTYSNGTITVGGVSYS